jgi:HK97 family phage prohead protease
MNELGEFSGYGTVWGAVDAYNETLSKGSIKKSLKKRKPAMLWQHDARQPVGVWSSMKEDDHGLALEGKLVLDATLGKDTYALMKSGAVSGLSIGFMPSKWDVDQEKKGLINYTEIDLWEISIVTFPALQSATIENVKSFFGEAMPTERDVEAFLREAGLSKTQAMTFISKGYKACLRDSGSDEVKTQEQILQNINSLLGKFKK